MEKLSNFLYTKTNLAWCLNLTIVMVLFAWLVMGGQSVCISSELPEGMSLLGLSFGYDQPSVLLLMKSVSTGALKCYSTLLLVWDNLFPFTYCCMYLFWLSYIFKRQQFQSSFLRLINLFPILPMLMDFVENHFENALIIQYLEENTVSLTAVRIASLATQIKWTLSSINYVIILVGIILLIKAKIRR